MTKIYIKNMVCDRCKLVVTSELEKLGVHPLVVELGEVTLETDLDPSEKENFGQALETLGFEIIDTRKNRLVEKAKTLIIDLVHRQNGELKINLSDYLAGQLQHDYKYISNLFSEMEGSTVEKYFIAQKIEKVKELLAYDELTLSEIAYRLNYSSVAHLSNQFKKVTGMSPSDFKSLDRRNRKPLDGV